MTREDNPYFNLISMMRDEWEEFNPAPFFIGKVTAAEPLTVQVGDISITRENMKINSMMLGGYSRDISIAETGATGTTAEVAQGGNDYAAFASHSHSIQSVGIPDGRMTMTDGLQVGDEVLLLVSEDGQQYILICKLA
ncbi:MAG: DUF2577 domain-containing protein [Anaerotignum sp.]|nr:DUF2577 domain-containing protein [Anaerotignum sp.]